MTRNAKHVRVTLLATMITAALSVSTGALAAPPLKVVNQIGQPATNLPATRLIVRYRDTKLAPTVKLAAVNSAARRARAGVVGASAPVSAPTAGLVRRLAVGADLIKLSRRMDAAELGTLMKEIAADPSVKYVQVDRMLQHTGTAVAPQFTPNDPLYLAASNYQWHLKATAGGVNAEPAWDIATGSGVVVAVIDTGITPHPDMDASMLPGYDFITDTFVSRRPTAERVPGAMDYGDWYAAGECGAGSTARNSSFHGTHVSGTVAEQTNNGIGMAGVAYNAKVLPIRVLGRCGGYTSDIADAIVWASGGTVAGVPDNANPAEVINMSLGGSGSCDPISQDAINSAVSRGTTVVVAAGNSNAEVANHSPASCANVISVAAGGVTGARASYSNYGKLIDLMAPGGSGTGGATGYVYQARNGSTTAYNPAMSTYVGFTGTSMASPHVAGVVALIQSAAATPLTPARIERVLKANVRPFPAAIPAGTPSGKGLLDAKLALDAALLPPPTATALVNKLAVTGLNAPAGGSSVLYSIEVPAGASLLNVMTYGGTGNASLAVSLDFAPTSTAADYRSVRPGNTETVRVSNPEAGTYYVLVYGTSAYGNVSLQARVD